MDSPGFPTRGGGPEQPGGGPPEPTPGSESERLERLWQGSFGDAYTERNAAAGAGRAGFWRDVLAGLPCHSVLEVGCNLGANLGCIARALPGTPLCGVDLNQHALLTLKAALPAALAVQARARDLPFADASFDLVFTQGVLIHQPEDALARVMSEVVRCSRRFVLAGEYFAEQTTEVAYRGNRGALFRRDYGGLYARQHPGLRLARQGFLGKEQGFDDVTWWLFERSA